MDSLLFIDFPLIQLNAESNCLNSQQTERKQTIEMFHVNSNNNNNNNTRKRVSATEIKLIPTNEYKRKSSTQLQFERLQEKCNNNKKKNVVEIDDRLKWTAWYSTDIYEYWKSVELNRDLFDITSEFFAWRPQKVAALMFLVRKYGFNNLTLHLAIHILDTFLSKNQQIIAKEERKLTVITCFIVAAKVEEDEIKIPTLSQLNKAMLKMKNGRPYTLEEYEIFEIKVLRCTQFKLTVPTVATFANFFSRTTVNIEDFQRFNEQANAARDDVEGVGVGDGGGSAVIGGVMAAIDGLNRATATTITTGQFNSHEHMLTAVNNLLFRLVDITGELLFLRNTLPSQIAAACVFAARHLTNIQPNWSQALETLTQYDESDMLPIAQPIIEIYMKQLIA